MAAAGKGTKYRPADHHVTPDEVWQPYGLTPDQAAAAGMNGRMFNSFLDGTKSAIEMAAIANASGLDVPEAGLGFPPRGVDDPAHVLRPRALGGQLERDGVVEVVSSRERDGRRVFRDLCWGVRVGLKPQSDYAAASFAQYGLPTDATGRHAAMQRPFHLIGMELSIGLPSPALRGEATGQARGWRGDVVAVAKRDLAPGEMLDGQGGHTVWGRAVPAAVSAARRLLPIGLAHRVRLVRAVARDQMLTMADVALNADSPGLRLRRDMLDAGPQTG